MADWVKLLLKLAIPPRGETEADPVYFHRVRTALVACAALLLAIAIVAYLSGLFSPRLPPMIREDQVELKLQPLRDQITKQSKTMSDSANTLQASINADRVEHLESELMRMRILNCSVGKGRLKDLYWQRIQDLTGRYRDVANRDYQLPACGDL